MWYYVGPLNLTFVSNIVVVQSKSLQIQFLYDTVFFFVFFLILAVMTKFVFSYISFSPFPLLL